MQMNYYDEIASGYDELHKEEQLGKCRLIAENFDFDWKNKKILDVGCGTGIASGFFSCHTGVDPSEKLLNIASKKFPEIRFIKANAERLPFEDEEFDAAISLTALQNFDDVEQGLEEIKRVGREFVLSFLKKSDKKILIEDAVRKRFKIRKEIEEEKDIILFCHK